MWLECCKTEKKKKFYVQTDNFRVIQEKVYYEVIGYMKKFLHENKSITNSNDDNDIEFVNTV